MDGLTLENQAVCLPIIVAHSYLLAIYFAFGRQTLVYRSVVLSMGMSFIAFEATWIHATLMDIRDPTSYLRWLSQNVVVFVVPSATVAILLLPLRTFFYLRGQREKCTILHLMIIALLVSLVMAIVRYNQFSRYLFDWSALGEYTICNTLLAFSLYAVLLAHSGYQRLLGAIGTIATLAYQVHSMTSGSSPWNYVSVLLPWFIYVLFLHFLRRHLSPEKSVAITNDCNQAFVQAF